MRASKSLLFWPISWLACLCSAASLGGEPASDFLAAACDGAALLGSDAPQPLATRASTTPVTTIRMRRKRRTVPPVTMKTRPRAASDALIVISELQKLAPAPAEVHGCPPPRQAS